MGQTYTIEPVRAGDFASLLPEFGRTTQVEAHFGIKKGTLYNLEKQGKVRGKVLRVTGELKGVRLWDMHSIRDFIHSQSDTLSDAGVAA